MPAGFIDTGATKCLSTPGISILCFTRRAIFEIDPAASEDLYQGFRGIINECVRAMARNQCRAYRWYDVRSPHSRRREDGILTKLLRTGNRCWPFDSSLPKGSASKCTFKSTPGDALSILLFYLSRIWAAELGDPTSTVYFWILRYPIMADSIPS